MAGKQAKTLSTAQIGTVLMHLSGSRYAARDRAMFLLSIKAGLRAKEIAMLEWVMVLTADGQVGDALHLEDRASKGTSGRTIPLNRELRAALIELHGMGIRGSSSPVIFSERGIGMSANTVVAWFGRLYDRMGFLGCSSHSGRRTFVTTAAKKVGMAGGSLRDVQQLAGHSSLQMTARYIEGDTDAKRKLVNLI
ncbi:putative Integrase-like domain [Magnetospirillum sp. XM-1]|uniref:tyrosine-type recombinase/integrase n=1 Tax=Magnetospirillum sp. XM-1 TaxID=1663591 RepID=UPI00073E0694|nr:site-specific integrase [Magnetospirillum sp. XM-1]CUW39894.1 putative Integrase-like domain [Magnetospirillum sp. XM-1]